MDILTKKITGVSLVDMLAIYKSLDANTRVINGIIIKPLSYTHFLLDNNNNKFTIITEEECNFSKYLIDSPSNIFDFVHTECVSDLQKTNLDSFLQQIYRCVKKNGHLIMKRNINNYNLKRTVSEYFSIIKDIPKDNKYLETIIAYKS